MEVFSFTNSLQLEAVKWMLRLSSLEVNKSAINTNGRKKSFQVYFDADAEENCLWIDFFFLRTTTKKVLILIGSKAS